MPGVFGITVNGIYNYMNGRIMQKDIHDGVKTIGEAILKYRESSKTAVICEDREMSYSRLCDEGMRIAWGLTGRGIKKGDRVAIDMERSESYISVLLGIALAGCIGINIHKSWPPKYRESVLLDCSPSLMITDELVKELVTVTVECPLPMVCGNDPYFITYTSGSTGSPKGGVTFHEALLNNSLVSDQNIRNKYVVEHCERHLIDINFSYLALLLYLMPALINEKTVVLANDDEMAFPAMLGRCIQRNHVDHIFRVPSAMLRALDDPVFSEAVKEIKACSTGGEQITAHAARIISEHMPKAVLFCTYGSTELLMVSACVYQPGEQDLLGTPYENTSLYVLDENGEKVPDGSEGELCIGGMAAQVGCYWNAPDLTESKYEVHPEYGRLFHSGDKVRVEGKGRLRILGRLDGMIKLFGKRIEPETIERALLSYPGIREAAVAVIEDETKPELTAYYVAEDMDPDEGALRRHLVSLLPYYMIPVRMISLEEMPLNMNGKLDRKALKEAQARRRVSVLTPIRNTPVALFERAFESLRKQSFGFQEIEWVIVLHNCTDSYKEDICNRLNGYPNIHIYISDVPGTNIGYARNQTLARATGEYIFFMDADDEMRPDCIEKVIRKMEESGADTSVMDSVWYMHGKGIPYWTDGDPDGENIYKKGDPNIGKSLCLSGLTLWTRCYRRRFLAEEGLVFDETRENGEDFFFNLEATGKANLVAVLPGYCGYEYYSGIGMTKEIYSEDLLTLPESELICKAKTDSKLFAEVYRKGTEAGLFMDNYLWFGMWLCLRNYEGNHEKSRNSYYSEIEEVLLKLRVPRMIWSERQPIADFIWQRIMEGYYDYCDSEDFHIKDISLNECERLTSGTMGAIYELSPQRVFKLYPGTGESIRNEVVRIFKIGTWLFKNHYPIAFVYYAAKSEKGYGLVMERVAGTSMLQAVLDQPEKLKEYGRRIGNMLRKLHTYDSDSTVFPSVRRKFYTWIAAAESAGVLRRWESARLKALINSIPDSNTVLHLDISLKNIMLRDDEIVLIDPDNMAIGNPFFELISMYTGMISLAQIGIYNSQRELTQEQYAQMFSFILSTYFGTEDKALLDQITDMLRGYSLIMLMCGAVAIEAANVQGLDPKIRAGREAALAYKNELFSIIDTLHPIEIKTECKGNGVFDEE